MTTKRTKDPAGLRGTHVHVEIDGAEGDLASAERLLSGASPAARIKALRVHPELCEVADALEARLVGPRLRADMHLMHDIAQAEYLALAAAATPKAIIAEVVTEQRRKAGFSSGAERAAERKPEWDLWQAEVDRVRAANPSLSKSRILEVVAATFGKSRQGIAKRVTVATERPRCKK